MGGGGRDFLLGTLHEDDKLVCIVHHSWIILSVVCDLIEIPDPDQWTTPCRPP